MYMYEFLILLQLFILLGNSVVVKGYTEIYGIWKLVFKLGREWNFLLFDRKYLSLHDNLYHILITFFSGNSRRKIV